MTGELDGQRFAPGGLCVAILDSAHALVVILDAEGRIVGFNRACELLTGYDADEVVGTHIWDRLLPEEAIEPIRQIFASLPEGGEVPEEYENAWVTRDGHRPIIAWNNSVMRDAAGDIEVIVGIGVDITERRETADRLAKTANDLATAQQLTRIGSWRQTVATQEEEWSDQFYRNLGLEPGSCSPSVEKFYEHVHPDDRQTVKETVQRSIEEKQRYTRDFRVVWPDGSVHSVHEENDIVLDEEGEVVALTGTMQDVTELRESEDHLQRLTLSFANAQRIAQTGNWDWDAVTKVEWWSDEVYRIMGLEPGSVTSSIDGFMKRTHPDDRKKVKEAIDEAQGSLQSYDVIFRIVRRSGEERVVRETGECVLDTHGRLTGLTGTVQDITEQHAARQALSETAGRLEAAMRLANLGNWEWEPESNSLKMSAETLRICGLGPEHAEVDNDFLMAMIPEEEHAQVLRMMDSAISGKGAYTNEYHIVRPDGDIRTVFEHGEAFHDETAGQIRLIGTIQDITERKRIERALQESEARLRGLFEYAPVGIGLADLQANLIEVNQPFADFLGYSIEELPGLSYRDFTHPDHLESTGRQVEELLAGPATRVSEEKLYIRRDGAAVWGNRTLSLIRDEAGDPKYMVVIVEDIDERKHAEKELALTTERLEDAQRIAHIGHWEWLPGSTDTVWSDEMYRIFGLEPGAIHPTHDTFFGMVHEDDRKSIATMMADTVESGQPYETEFRIIRADGAMRHVFERGERYVDEQTGEWSVRGIMQDITERKTAENKLRETAENLEKSQRIAKLGSWIWMADEDKEWWSDEVYRIFGLEVGSVVLDAYGFLGYVHPDDQERVRAAVGKTINEGVPYVAEYRVQRPDGREVAVSEFGEMEYDANGKPLYMHGTVQDITERKAADEKLREIAANLENSERIAHLGTWVWDIVEDNEWWSDELYRIFGLEVGSVAFSGFNFLDYVHPDDRERMREIVDRSYREGAPFIGEYRIIRTDGTERIISEVSEVEYDPHGKPIQLRGTTLDITERKAVEEKLLETAENLEKSQRIAKLGSWVWEIEEDKEWWSDEIYRMLGWEIGSMDGRGLDYLEYVHPDDRENARAAMDKTLKEHVPYVAEYRIRHADGHDIFVSEYAETEYDGADKPVRMRGITQDITERKAAEEKLRDTAENLEKSQRIAKLGSWVWEIEEDKEWWSDEIYRFLGMENGPAVVSGYDYLKYVHPDDQERVRAALDKSLRENVPYVVEYRIQHADGHEIIISEHAETEYDGAGKPVRMRGTAQDITERKQAELVLQQTMARLEEAQQIGQMGSWTWDPEEDVEWWSNQHYRIFGLEPGSITLNGFDFLKYVHPDDYGRVEKIEREAVENRTPFSVEYRVIRPDGAERIVSEYGEWSEDKLSGKPKWRGVVHDITERKRIEQELVRLNSELEQRVEERTAELREAQGELVKSERLATLGQLTATVSHELRNPLGAMRTSMYVVEKKTDSDDQRLQSAIDRVNRSITRCDQIIDELLDYTRIRDLSFQETNIDDWLGAVLGEQTVPDGITVKHKFGTSGFRVPADSDRLRRAFINVFENACQAASNPPEESRTRHRPLVTVETRLRKDKLEILITDNGPGVPADIRSKIFEPLFSTKNFGVGLGLPTVKQIMEQHGGGVTVGERRGGGAKFALCLPLAEELEIAEK